MATIEIYTTPMCGFCRAAKRLLDQKGVGYTEIDVAGKPAERDKMTQRAGGSHTVPQIFIDRSHIGGCDELYALDRTDRLDPMLQG